MNERKSAISLYQPNRATVLSETGKQIVESGKEKDRSQWFA
jgi:hypothetical protein